MADGAWEDGEHGDTVHVPGGEGVHGLSTPETYERLTRVASTAGRIASICTGSYLLAEAGLLDGRTACTHWVWADDFNHRFPNVTLTSDVLYHDDDNIVTSAGTAAAIDCCLHLLRRDQGAEVANRIARRMVTAPHRNGGQAQFIERPVPQRVDADPIADTLQWALEHLAEPIGLDALAEHAMTSRRTFSRHFRKATGTTVTSWLLTQRLSLAQQLLETTDDQLERVAQDAGFGSASTMRQHFTAAISVSPSAYRKQYRPDFEVNA